MLMMCPFLADYVTFLFVEDLSFMLYNPVGQQVARGAIRNELDFSDLPSGLYTLQIRNERTGMLQVSKVSLLR